MAWDPSDKFARVVNAVSPDEPDILLLELDHPDWANVLRVVVDKDHFPYGQAYVFTPGAGVALNAIVTPAEHNGYYYKATVAGALGGAEPTWPTTIGATVASGAATLRCEGHQYGAVAVDISLPQDVQGQLVRVPIAIDNTDPTVARMIDASGGGEGMTCRVMQTLRSQPTVIEYDTTLSLTKVRVDGSRISGELGYDDFLNMPAVALFFTPKTAPGLH